MKWTKDKDATLDYSLNWADWLPEGDTITNAQWLVPEGLELETSAFTDTITTVWLSGGEDKQKYGVTCRISTEGGRVDDRTISITIKER